MSKLLWTPSDEVVERANITRFIDYVNGLTGLNLEGYWELYRWSIEDIQYSGEDA